jgi:hypothetical protein
MLAVVLCLLITVPGISCSDSDDSTKADGAAPAPSRTAPKDSPPATLITDADVEATPQGSPERTVFEFFQAVQFQDIEAIRPLATREARRELGGPGLAAAVTVVGPAIGKPQLFDTRRTGDRATVRLLVLGFAPGRDKPATSVPATFVLSLRKGVWQLASLKYLETTGNTIAEERERVEKAR